MKKLLKWTAICFLCIIAWGGTGMFVQASETSAEEGITEEEIKVLMIGNSFTKYSSNPYGVGSILQEMAAINNKKVSVTTIAHNGAYLSYYAFWSSAYKGYYDEVLSALKNEQYDYIILQDQTKAGIEKYETEMLPSVKQLYTYINAYQSQAKVLLYETASYSDGSKIVVDGKSQMLTQQEFQEKTLYGYTRLQNETGVEMIPAGMQVYHATGVYPTINMISNDSKHPSYAGYYVVALCIYHKIYGEEPVAIAEKLSYCNIDDSQLAKLNGLVDDTITISKRNLTLAMGASEKLTASIGAPAGRKGEIFWKSLNSDIVTIDSKTGKVTGIAEGSTAVLAETTTGLMEVCCVTVENTTPSQLSFGKTYYQVGVRDKIRLLPKMTNWQVGDICKWSTSNASVATVSSNGTVTAKKMGKAVIKVKNSRDSSISASYILYVSGNSPAKLSAKVSSVSTTAGKIKLSWGKVYGATKYRIYRYNSSTGTYNLIGTSTTNSYTDSTVKTNQYYYYKVSAMAGSVLTESNLSSKVRTMILGTVTPKVKATSQKCIELSWNRNSKAAGYVIYRSTKKSSGYKKIATIYSNKKIDYYDSTVKKGKTYYYKIRAYRKESGKTSYSSYSKTVKGQAVNK